MATNNPFSWSDIAQIFNPEYQYEIVKSDGQIRLSRSKQIQGATHKIVWQKECIQQSDPALGATEGARLTHKFLRAMSHHELAMLQAISTSGLRYCSLPFRILQENSYLRTVVIETVDAGPSLDYWRNLGRYMDGSPPDFFANPIALLRITRGILQALEEFHDVGNVHLDLAWRNVCLSLSESMRPSPDLTSATLKPNWQTGVKLIDFGFSVGNNIIPPVWLMATGQGTTTHRYKKQQDSIAKEAEVIFQSQNNNCSLPSHIEALVHPFWWKIDRRSHLLRQFSDNLDGREDIYALGNMLMEVKPIKHPNAGVNDLVASLPQTLINAGLSDDATRFAYQHWITKIDEVLALCPNDIKATDELTIVNCKSDDPSGGAARVVSFDPDEEQAEQQRQAEARERQRKEDQRQAEKRAKQTEAKAHAARKAYRQAKQAAALAKKQRRKAAFRKLLGNGYLHIVLLAPLVLGPGVVNMVKEGSHKTIKSSKPKKPSNNPSRIILKDCNDCPQLVVIPTGKFTMGSPNDEPDRSNNEGPQHPVTINYRLAVGQYEVSFAEWDACVADHECDKPDDNGWGRGNRPVINVSWNDITKQYLPWLNKKAGLAKHPKNQQYRLLSEAEWEYAARAGSATAFTWGADINTTLANYDGNSSYNGSPKGEYRQKTLPVDSFAANAWGLYNVHGNVWEWVADCYQDSYADAPDNGAAAEVKGCPQRVLRGGSWFHVPLILRSANRDWFTPDSCSVNWGFRVARMLP